MQLVLVSRMSFVLSLCFAALTIAQSEIALTATSALPLSGATNGTTTLPAVLTRSALKKRHCERAEDPTDSGEAAWTWVCDDEFPTVGEMLAHMENTKKVNKESHALFYTNLADDAKESLVIAAAWMTSQGKTFYSYQDAVDKDWMTQQLRWIGEDNPELFADRYARHGSVDALSIFSICYNQALAVAAINPDAYLFIRHDVEPEAMSTWSRVEYPFLTLNQNIQRIWRVDPRPPEQGGRPCEPHVMWDRSKDEPAKLAIRYCPEELS